MLITAFFADGWCDIIYLNKEYSPICHRAKSYGQFSGVVTYDKLVKHGITPLIDYIQKNSHDLSYEQACIEIQINFWHSRDKKARTWLYSMLYHEFGFTPTQIYDIREILGVD